MHRVYKLSFILDCLRMRSEVPHLCGPVNQLIGGVDFPYVVNVWGGQWGGRLTGVIFLIRNFMFSSDSRQKQHDSKLIQAWRTFPSSCLYSKHRERRTSLHHWYRCEVWSGPVKSSRSCVRRNHNIPYQSSVVHEQANRNTYCKESLRLAAYNNYCLLSDEDQ